MAVGQQISDGVEPVEKCAEDYINYDRHVPDLMLQNTTPEHVYKTIKTLSQKTAVTRKGFQLKWLNLLDMKFLPPLRISSILASVLVFSLPN